MSEDTYKTIAVPSEGLYKSKGSSFLAFAYPVATEQEARENLKMLKSKYHDARHHCYAWILGRKKEKYRSSDDREPSGTAGKPILGQINSYGLTNIEVIVVRYFGGTLLGTSGLIEAYRSAARNAIKNAPIIEKTENAVFKINFSYGKMNELLRLVKEEKAEILSSHYETEGSVEISIRFGRSGVLREKLSLLAGIQIFEED